MWNKETTKKAIGLLSRNLQFVLVFLISLTALLWVWQQDREFHNDKPMPIIIVGEKGPEDSKEADTGRFSVSEIQNLIAPEQSLAPDQMNILELGLLDLNQLKLNDVGDLKNRLTERLIAQRDNKQNFLRTRIDGLELERLRNKFEMLNQYRTDTTDSTTSVDIESLISDLQAKQSAKDASVRNSRISINVPQSFNARASLINSLEGLKSKYKEPVDKDTLFQALSANFRNPEIEDSITGYKKEIGELSNKFGAVFKQISDSDERLGSRIKPQGWNALAVYILDEDGPLNIIYTLVNIILGFIVLSSLLYVIVQPLTGIFFLSGYTESLGQRIQDLFASGQTLAGPSIAVPTLVAAVSAVGIGSVALAGNQFDHQKSPNQAQAEPAPAVSNEFARNGASAKAFERVADSVEKLNRSVSNLEIAPGGTTVVELDPVVRALDSIYKKLEAPNDYSGEFKDVMQRIGNPPQVNPNGNLFGEISRVGSSFDSQVSALNENIGAVSRQVGDIDGRVGRPDDSVAARTVFGKTNATKKVAEDTYRVAENTYGIAKLTSEVAEETKEISVENWRNQAGRNGKNLVTQARVLFSPERYAISVVALRQIEREISRRGKNGPDPFERRMLDRLGNMVVRGTAMDRKQLAGELSGVAGEKTWKKWRPLILRYTRVSRK